MSVACWCLAKAVSRAAGVVALFLSVILSASPSLAQSSPAGFWRTVPDDNTAPATIKIWVENGKLFGKVVAIHARPGDDPSPKCLRCEGALKDKPVVNMTILQNLAPDGAEWSGGTILDPAIGKQYRCTVKVVDGGAKLKVRGYVGVSLFGRTQYWIATKSP